MISSTIRSPQAQRAIDRLKPAAPAAPIKLLVYGSPQPGGSKRAFPFKRGNGKLGVRVTDDNPKAKDWKSAVAWAARAAHKGPLLDGPLRVTMIFYRPRPKGHWRKDGITLSTEGERNPFPITKPDRSKLARSTEDALTGVLWRDDAQIVDGPIIKLWGEPAHAAIIVTPLCGSKPVFPENEDA